MQNWKMPDWDELEAANSETLRPAMRLTLKPDRFATSQSASTKSRKKARSLGGDVVVVDHCFIERTRAGERQLSNFEAQITEETEWTGDGQDKRMLTIDRDDNARLLNVFQEPPHRIAVAAMPVQKFCER